MTPGPAPQRRIAPPERRKLIEQAAERLFAEHGYTATTVDDIVVAAGVTKPMLYRHFDSKKAVYVMLLERHRDALAAGPLDAYIYGAGTLEERLPAMLESWFSYVETHPFAWRLLSAQATDDPEIQALHRELQRRQRAADAAIIRESLPAIDDDQVEPLAEIVRASLTGLALWWHDNPDTPRATLVDTMLRLLRGLVATAAPTAG
jgi:AcrR family transcriptional regulator